MTYQVSKIKLEEDVDSYVSKIMGESLRKQEVKVRDAVVNFGVEGPIVFPNGKFWMVDAKVEPGSWGTHYVMVSPDLPTILKRGECFIRLDSGCMSGVLGDTTCDCMEQLRVAQNIALKKGGIIIHIPEQDGRGYKNFKMANQRIMDETKLDTITVASKFYGHHRIDIRTYKEAVDILKALGFPRGYKFDLGTKNPNKIGALKKGGFKIIDREIKVGHKNGHIKKNLKAKHLFWKGEKHERDKKRQMVSG